MKLLKQLVSKTLGEFELHKIFSQSKLKFSIEIIIMKFPIDFILSCKLFSRFKAKILYRSFNFARQIRYLYWPGKYLSLTNQLNRNKDSVLQIT